MTSVNNNSEPFGLDIDEKVMFFIEGANLHALAKNLDMHMDFAKLHAYFQKHCRFVRANYYTTMNEDAEYNSIRPLIDWLSYNGYNVLTKPAKEHVDSLGRRKIKGNVDVEIAVDMLEAAKTCDHIVLFSSDADFLSAVTAVQRMGVRVTVVSTIPSVGDELRRRADHFVDLDKVRHLVGKPLTPHAASPAAPRRASAAAAN